MSEQGFPSAGAIEYADVLDSPEAPNVARVAEFQSFVAQNAEVLVESSRAPGIKMPFGVLMNMCAAEITEDNVELFFDEAHAMLAGSSLETEEKEEAPEDEENKGEEDSGVKSLLTEKKFVTGVPDADKLVKTPDQDQSKSHNQEVERSDNKDQGVENGHAREDSMGGLVAQESTAPRESAQMTAESEKGGYTPLDKPSETDISSSKSLAIKDSEEKLSTIIDKVNVKPPGLEITQSPPSSERKEEALLSKSGGLEAKSMPEEVIAAALKVESDKKSPSLLIDPRIELADFDDYPVLELGLDEITEAEPVKNSFFLDNQPLEKIAYESFDIPNDEGIGFYGHELTELGTDQLELSELVMEESDIFVPDTDKKDVVVSYLPEENLFAVTEIQPNFVNQTTQLSLPIKEVEESFNRLVGAMEELELEKAEDVRLMIDKAEKLFMLVEIIAIEAPDKADSVKEELREEFANLFDYVGLEYTPELLNSLIQLALYDQLIELDSSKAEDTADAATHDKGTHELIKQILVSISSVKKIALNAYLLGKSAIRLYRQDLLAINIV